MANSLLNPTTTLPTVPITLTAQTDGDFPAPTSIGNSPLIPTGVDSGDFTAQSAISLLHPTRVDSGDFTAPSSDDDFAAQTVQWKSNSLFSMWMKVMKGKKLGVLQDCGLSLERLMQ
ncbi:hypothetical protein OROGR_010722 [Orobanche gracilis]